MTGYAAATAESARGTLALELRSVNSRFLDIQMRVAEELRSLEAMLRERIAERVARGKIDCRLSFVEGSAPAGMQQLNAAALGHLQALAKQAQQAFPKAEGLRVADVLRWPGVVGGGAVDERELRGIAEQLCRRALDDLIAARSREGAKLAGAVAERIAAMRSRVDAVAPLLPQSVSAYKDKLTARLREAIGSVDDERVRAEVAVFVAKIDVDEEMTRLRAHLAEVERVLKEGGSRSSSVGKRLDFLAQELNREANTLASKAASQAVTEAALELKLLVEQVREQVQNIE